MSDELHDQNKSTETPNTAPSFFRVLGIGVVVYLIMACLTYIFFFGVTPDIEGTLAETTLDPQSEAPLIVQASGGFPPSAYLRSEGTTELIDPQLALANLSPVADVTELATLLGNNPEISVIFLDSQMLGKVDSDFIQGRYESGDVLIGLRVPHSEFSAFMGVEPTVADLTTDEMIDNVIWASVLYTSDGEPQELVKAYDQFPAFISEVHNLR